MTTLKGIALLLVLLLASSLSAKTKTVSITPLGARTGEFAKWIAPCFSRTPLA